ncbi:MAG: hypothetical protein KF795_00645 [Labilithrix sp.]|nr:hypothetical protein [Labilithrix sp.]
MIDDVWITNHVPDDVALDVREDLRLRRLLTTDPRSGRTFETSLFCRGFTALMVTPDTRTVTMRLSVPRMHGFYNFPLRALPLGHGSMTLDAPLTLLQEVTTWRTSMPLEFWPVCRVTFGLDLFVGRGNVLGTLNALKANRRKHSSAGTAWTNRQGDLTGVQFGGRKDQSYRAVFYDKGAEIMSRIPRLTDQHEPFDRGRAEDRRRLAEEAAGYIRFEVVLRGGSQIRKPFNLRGGLLPNLRLIALPIVSAYVIALELRKLGLDQLAVDLGDHNAERGFEALLSEISRKSKDYRPRQGSKPRATLTSTRQYLIFAHALALSEMSRKTVESYIGGSSMLYDLEADMRSIGLPVMGAVSNEPPRRLAEFMTNVRDQLPDLSMVGPWDLPDGLDTNPVAEGWATEAPWAASFSIADGNGIVVDDYDNEANEAGL